MTRILGIDPGSRMTGFGIIDRRGNRVEYLTSGVIRTQGDVFPERLRTIFAALSEIVAEHRPDQMAIEQVFVHRNPSSALKLGQARGAAICACVMADLPVAEYTPKEIKKAIVGGGAASKEQVEFMVRMLLKLDGKLALDASDALAVALCHSHRAALDNRLAGVARTP